MVRTWVVFIAGIIVCAGCVPESKKILTEVDIRSDDPQFRKIVRFEYLEQTDSLLPYLSSDDPTYRYLAARAFASHQDPHVLDTLATLLNDPVVKVRAMAAHAIGQIGDPGSVESLLAGFRQKDTMSVDNIGNKEILLAIGKVGNAELAEYMISAEGYRDSDTLLMEGILEGVYEFALRGIHSEEMTRYAVNAVRNNHLSDKARLYAAHYLARSRNLDIEKLKFQIAEAFVQEENTHIKMALASALKHTSDPEIHTMLLEQLDLELDYRIKCNIVKTLANYDYITSVEKILTLLENENQHLALCAVSYLKENGIKEDAYIYRQYARKISSPFIKSSLYDALMSIVPFYYSKTRNALRWEVQQLISESTDPYIIRNYLRALGNDPESYTWLMAYGKESDSVILRTAAAEALADLLDAPDFINIYRSYTNFHKRKIRDYFMELLNEDDEGLVASAALAIANKESGLHALIDSSQVLLDARQRLDNPGQIEAIHAIDKALATLRGVNEPNLTDTGKARVPDWTVMENAENNVEALIKTNKGLVTVTLFPERAPSAVLNFIDLAESDFYDDMPFHRVVPNFVIQTGSPRGDNYGGKDYVIKSNVANAYYDDTGYMGMASAGLHTESTQWFITHSPTPHLNGRYTIFGKVLDGMDVVHDIREGDIILDIIITGLK